MAQHFTDFSEYTVGAEPADWTNESGSGSASVTSYSGAPGGVSLSVAGGSIYSWDGKSGSDVEIVALIDSNGSNENVRLVIRGETNASGDYSGYASNQLSSAYIATTVYTAGGFSYVSFKSKERASPYWIRFRVNGGSVKVKLWGESESEPGTWDIEATDGTYTSGFTGVFVTSSLTADYLCFGVGTGGDPAPTSPVASSNPPAAPTGLTLTEL